MSLFGRVQCVEGSLRTIYTTAYNTSSAELDCYPQTSVHLLHQRHRSAWFRVSHGLDLWCNGVKCQPFSPECLNYELWFRTCFEVETGFYTEAHKLREMKAPVWFPYLFLITHPCCKHHRIFYDWSGHARNLCKL